MDPIQSIGIFALNFIQATGQICFLLADTFRCTFAYPFRFRLFWRQLWFIGVQSQGVVLITGAFTGAVFAAQTQFQFGRLGMNSAVGPVVSVAMCRELGPVLCALMVAGRVGSAIAAEISTMKTTEQLDALRALGIYPVQYLVVPRFAAMALSMPILTSMAIFLGIGSGYLVAVPILGVDGVYYWENTVKFTVMKDVLIGLTKAFIFGMIICMISAHRGLHAAPNAEGVGQATTQAAVQSSIACLIANFFLTFLLNTILPD
ncbi:MAG: ABC transporter permease [Methylacidiphilales bacterium]|nr:ABC transporter permease [Candidatus Methylacidiphilales bacterium]MDW8349481.1 ABC transporter permease [Verrucomicrobiae bacterium]